MMGATLLKGDTWPIAKLAIFFQTNTMLDQKTSKKMNLCLVWNYSVTDLFSNMN